MTPSSLKRCQPLEPLLRWGRTLLVAASLGLTVIYLIGVLSSVGAVGRAREELNDRRAQQQRLREAARQGRLIVHIPTGARRSDYVTAFVQDFGRLTRDTGCTLLLIQPGAAAGQANDEHSSLQVDLLGSYRSLIRLVGTLTASGWPVEIQEFTVSAPPSGQGDQLAAKLSLTVAKL